MLSEAESKHFPSTFHAHSGIPRPARDDRGGDFNGLLL